MSNYSSVLAFGDRMRRLSRLDAFVANAGIDKTHFELFEQQESIMTVDVISTFLIVMLAIQKLRETSVTQNKPSRLVFTGFVIHIFAKDKYLSQPGPGQIFDSLNSKETADMSDRYHLSKLVELLACRKLAAQLHHNSQNGLISVIATYANPGWCKTELFRFHDGGIGGRIGLRLIGRTAEAGSRGIVHAAAAADRDSHGKYLSECHVKLECTWVRSEEGASVEKRLWKELVDILEGIQPGVTNL